jgi:hypothetical protein
MVLLASHRGFEPEAILMDAWYTTVANLKTIDSLEWMWVAELQKNGAPRASPWYHHYAPLGRTPNYIEFGAGIPSLPFS